MLINGIESKIVHPEEVSAAVIGKMLDITEKSEGFRPKQAVITVPAYFNQAQKQATMEAAQKASLEVLQLVTEPAAAAFAFTFDREQFTEHYNLLVYDFGGGKCKNIYILHSILNFTRFWIGRPILIEISSGARS